MLPDLIAQGLRLHAMRRSCPLRRLPLAQQLQCAAVASIPHSATAAQLRRMSMMAPAGATLGSVPSAAFITTLRSPISEKGWPKWVRTAWCSPPRTGVPPHSRPGAWRSGGVRGNPGESSGVRCRCHVLVTCEVTRGGHGNVTRRSAVRLAASRRTVRDEVVRSRAWSRQVRGTPVCDAS